MKMPHHIISADQFNPELLEEIFEEAERIREIDEANPDSLRETCQNKSAALLFWEASTRTFISFYNAGLKLGMKVIPVLNAGQFSSVAKGESLEDTIRTCADLKVDAIIMRHNVAGSAQKAADILDRYAPSGTSNPDGPRCLHYLAKQKRSSQERRVSCSPSRRTE